METTSQIQNADKVKVPCAKCDGVGVIPFYRGIKGGVCFACGGNGYRLTTARKQAGDAAKKAAKKAEREARQAVARAEYDRKKSLAIALYAGDGRLPRNVHPDYFGAACLELAKLDGVSLD
jgi:RecJ-like exonuclease